MRPTSSFVLEESDNEVSPSVCDPLVTFGFVATGMKLKETHRHNTAGGCGFRGDLMLPVLSDYDLSMILRLLSVLPALLLILCLSGCKEERVDRKSLGARGPISNEERVVAPFEGIVVLGPTLTTISKGPLSKVQLKGPQNYLSALTTHVEKRQIGGSTREILVVDFNQKIKLPRVELSVTVPDLVYIEADGASQIKVGDFSRQELTIRADSGGKIELAPAAYGSVDIEVAKVARVLGKDVMVEKGKLRAYGAGLILLGQVAEADNEAVAPARISYQGRHSSAK